MNRGLKFEDAYQDELGNLFFFSYEINGIFKIDSSDNKAEFLLSIKEYDRNATRLFGTVVHYKNLLVFPPLSANDFLIYDMTNNSYSLIPVRERTDYIGDVAKFFSAYAYNDKVFAFPAHYPGIVCLDMKTYNLSYISDWVSEYKELMESGKDFFRQSICISNECLISPFCFSDDIMIFPLESSLPIIKHISTGRTVDQGFSGMYFDGENFWLSSMTGDLLIKLDKDFEVQNTYFLGNNNLCGLYAYTGIEYSDKHLFIKPAYKNDLCVLNIITGNIEKISPAKYEVDISVEGDYPGSIMSIKELLSGRIVMCNCNGTYFEIVMKDSLVSDLVKLDILFDEAMDKWSSEKGTGITSPLKENNLIDLKRYLNML